MRSNVRVSWAKCLLTLISVFMGKSDISAKYIERIENLNKGYHEEENKIWKNGLIVEMLIF